MSKSLEISVEAPPVWIEYVCDVLLSKIGCSGVSSNEKLYQDEVLVHDGSGIAKGYLPCTHSMPPDCEKIIQDVLEEREKLFLSGINSHNIGEWRFFFRDIPDEEWAHSWKQFWRPQKVSEKIVICPSWEDYKPLAGEIVLNLDPGSAFGTGTHPTTKLCLIALENIISNFEQQNKTNLNKKYSIGDIGTGSGILAVAGVLLGAESAIGVDNDASAIPVAVENAKKNSAEAKCKFFTGSVDDIKGQHEIVLANILPHVLIEIMNGLADIVKDGGYLVLSGIILEKSKEVQDSAVENGLKIFQILEEDNWIAIIAEK